MIKILLSGIYLEMKRDHFLMSNFKKAKIGSMFKVIKYGWLDKPKFRISF